MSTAGTISVGAARVDPYHARQLALQHAVTTHGATVDDDQVVKAAEAYLGFLTGGKQEEKPAPAARITVNSAKIDGETMDVLGSLGRAKGQADAALAKLRDAGFNVEELEGGNILIVPAA